MAIRGPATQEYGILCGCLEGHIWHSLVGPNVEARTKIGNLSVINQVLGMVGQLLQVLLLGWHPGLVALTSHRSDVG